MQILSRLQRLIFVQAFINILEGEKYDILSSAKGLKGNNHKHPRMI